MKEFEEFKELQEFKRKDRREGETRVCPYGTKPSRPFAASPFRPFADLLSAICYLLGAAGRLMDVDSAFGS
jgi:hypothetical protein